VHPRRARAVLVRNSFLAAGVPLKLLGSLVRQIEGDAQLLYGVRPREGGRLLLRLLLRHGEAPL